MIAGIVALATVVGVGAGVTLGRGFERRSAVPAAKAVPLAGGLPLIAGTTTTIAAGSGPVGVAGTAVLGTPSVGGSAPESPAVPPTTSLIAVHAAGAVARPGVYLLPADARVDDVLAAAGGPAPEADLDSVNLAEGVVDGMRVAFPLRGMSVPTITAPTRASAPSLAGAGPAAGSASSTVVPVDLNTASATDLDALPGVGPATAAAIIEFRTRNGQFRSVSQLLDVPGIGDAKLAALRPRVRV